MGGVRGGAVVCGGFEIQNNALEKRLQNIPGLTVIRGKFPLNRHRLRNTNQSSTKGPREDKENPGMLRAITCLLFGGEEQTPDDFKSEPMAEEEWQVVSHQEASSAEDPGPEQLAMERSSSGQHQDNRATNTKALDVISLADPEPVELCSATRPAAAGVAAQLKHPMVVEQLTLIQKARTWADRHQVTRNSMQRHNRARQGLQQSLFHLQQPGRRSLAH